MAVDSWQSSNIKVRDFVESDLNAPILEERMAEIQAIADQAIDIMADGFQWSDVISMFKFIGPLMDLAKEIEHFSGKQKEDFVVDAVWFIYKTVDTYPDGESNRINIPVLFGALETAAEKKFLDFSTRAAVKAVYSFGKKKGWFGSDSE